MSRLWTPNRPPFAMAPYGALVAACRPKMQQVAVFSPLDIAGLQLWLKADAGLYQDAAMTTPAVADADPVGGWADQSGQNNHATQATADSRPTLKLAIQNGKPVVRLATDDWLTCGDVLANIANPTMFMVTRVTDVTATQALAGKGDGGNYYESYALIVVASKARFGITKAGLVDAHADTVSSLVNNAFALICGSYDATNVSIWLNGGAPSQVGETAAIVYTAGQPFAVGVLGDLSSYPMTGDIAEMLVYNSALSTANRQAVESYLNSRWGVY